MALGTACVAYVVTIWRRLRLGMLLGLSLPTRIALAGRLGMATVALAYARHVDAHLVQLGATSALLVGLVRLAADACLARVAHQ